jgi:hypothetical protein
MTRRTRVGRLAWFIAAFLQLLVPTLWSVSDAHAEAVSARTATVHVEAPGSTKCPRVHPVDCAVCRVLAVTNLPSAPAPALVPCVPSIAARLADVARHWATARAAGDPPQRAPPSLS